jgi:hypothetical protein
MASGEGRSGLDRAAGIPPRGGIEPVTKETEDERQRIERER